jgi:hypothetical protein
MAFMTAELEFLSGQVWRVLDPKGLTVYTARNAMDPQ